MSFPLKPPRVKPPRSFTRPRPGVPFKFAYIPALGRVSLAGSAEWFDARGAGLPERTDTSGSAVYSGGVSNAERWTGVATGLEFTVIAVVLDSVGRGTNRSPVDADNNSTVGRNWQFRFGTSNRLEFFVFNTVPNVFGTGPTVTSSATEPSVMVGRVAGGVVNSWLNGVGGTPVTITGTQQTLLATEMLGIGGRVDSLGAVSQFFPGNIYGVFIADALPEALIESFVSPDEVWSWAFEPKRIWVPTTEVAGAVTLAAAGASQSATSAPVAIVQTHNLAGAATSQSASTATAVVGAAHNLAGAPSSQAAASSAAAVTQAHAISAAPASQSAASTAGSVVQAHVLAGASSSQAAESDAGAIAQHHVLVSADCSQAADSTVGDVEQTALVAGASASQSATSAGGAATQVHTLSAAATTQSAVSGVGAVAGTGVLLAAPSEQTANSDAGVVTQVHVLAGAGSSQAASSATASLSVTITLVGAPASQSAQSTTGAISQGHNLVAFGAAQNSASGSAAVTQAHALEASAVEQFATSENAIIVQGHNLTAVGATQSAAAGTGEVSLSTGGGTGATAAQIWGHVLPNGMTAADTLVGLYTRLDELHRLHGLNADVDLVVGPSTRVAGAIVQTVQESAGTVTVRRQ